MALVEDHDVVETFATDRTDHALDVRVLPGRSRRRDHFRDVHRFDPVAEIRAIRRIAIAHQIARSGLSSIRGSHASEFVFPLLTKSLIRFFQTARKRFVIA